MVKYAATSDAPRVPDVYISKIGLSKGLDNQYPRSINVMIEVA